MKKLALIFFVLIAGGSLVLKAQETGKPAQPKLEVYYFHATMRCQTCLAVEEQTRKTLDDYFANDLQAGTIQLQVLNLEEKDNRALVDKFEIGWSSLILYVPASGKTVNLTEDAFANARSHPEEFRTELEKQIKELM